MHVLLSVWFGKDASTSHMHRDLKPENIMLRNNESIDPVIGDFGLASNVDQEKYLYYRCGTPGYVAPEIVTLTENGHVEP